MNAEYRVVLIPLAIAFVLLFAGCGGGGDSTTSNTYSSPAWNLGDSMTYRKTDTVGGVATVSEPTYVVTERTPTAASLTNGATTRRFTAADGRYVPEFERATMAYQDDYTSTTTYSPPPAVGESYEYTTFVAGPWPGSGYVITTAITVSASTPATVSVPVGTFSAREVVLEKPVNGGVATITRYYVSGIGVVKEVEENPDTGTIRVEELTGYNFSGPALGSESNPIAAVAPATYGGRVGTGKLYFRISGLPASGGENIYLTRMSDNADLQVYSDAFVTLSCSSSNPGVTDDQCQATTSAAGELHIIVDGSLTTDGTYFVLSVGN
ncbi:MAG: hypothetical protein KKH12_03260 [Gammaproteobacteria bacterium]|nr:hypothetical protein [Gammaproteobacteria bacterium]MBU1480674.1 hypothetical protein [Gammaproteobacteria bacterium]